jgi:hypothetical protein
MNVVCIATKRIANRTLSSCMRSLSRDFSRWKRSMNCIAEKFANFIHCKTYNEISLQSMRFKECLGFEIPSWKAGLWHPALISSTDYSPVDHIRQVVILFLHLWTDILCMTFMKHTHNLMLRYKLHRPRSWYVGNNLSMALPTLCAGYKIPDAAFYSCNIITAAVVEHIGAPRHT